MLLYIGPTPWMQVPGKPDCEGCLIPRAPFRWPWLALTWLPLQVLGMLAWPLGLRYLVWRLAMRYEEIQVYP